MAPSFWMAYAPQTPHPYSSAVLTNVSNSIKRVARSLQPFYINTPRSVPQALRAALRRASTMGFSPCPVMTRPRYLKSNTLVISYPRYRNSGGTHVDAISPPTNHTVLSMLTVSYAPSQKRDNAWTNSCTRAGSLPARTMSSANSKSGIRRPAI